VRDGALGDTHEVANTLDGIGHPHVALGEHGRAHAVWREALKLCWEEARDIDADLSLWLSALR
jgi:hypothetical protein